MAEIARTARRKGCNVGFDLAHAIGNVPLALHDWDVDFAVWCSYKYLNGGPGAIGGCFVHERHAHTERLSRFAGWWGHDKATRFAMPPTFRPLPGAEGWQLSNPPILAMAPLLASLELFHQAELPRLRAKSVRLTRYLQQSIEQRLSSRVTVISPTDDEARGAQLSLRLNAGRDRAKNIHSQLTDRGYICDWREPDIVRVAPVPMYTTYREVSSLVETLLEIVD